MSDTGGVNGTRVALLDIERAVNRMIARHENAASERRPAARAIDPRDAVFMLRVILLRQIEELVELAEADARHVDETRTDRHQ
jgi:hypothetical protein